MQYTGALLITEVIKEIGENSTDTNYRLFTLNWFQEAFDIMVNELRDSNFLNVVENLSTVADTNGYGVTSGELIQGNIIGVRNKSQNYALTYLDLFEIKRLNWDLEATGTPRYYYQYGYDLNKKSSLIYFYPIPNGVYSLEVSYKLQSYLFADDSNVVRIPRFLASPLRFYVKAMACAREGEESQSQAYLQLFYKQINDLKRTRSTIADETHLQVTDIPEQYYIKQGRNQYNWDTIGGSSVSGVSSVSIAVPSYMSESGSPITSSGTITLSFNNQSGRKFFASPADGTSGAMSMRAIVANDLPTHTHLSADITDLVGGTTSFTDDTFEIKDNSDTTKKAIFQASGITTGTTRTYTFPNVSGTLLTSASSAGDFPTLNQNTTGNAATATTASDVTDNVSIQKVEVTKNSGAVVGTRKQLNFVEGSNITLTIADDSGNDQVDITIAASGGGSGAISSLTAASSTNTINNATYTQEWQWNTLAGASGLKLTSTSTAAASNAQTILEIAQSGANSSSSQTTYGLKVSNAKTGTSSTNRGGWFSASGGTTNESIYSDAGDVYFRSGSNYCHFQHSTGHLIVRNGTIFASAIASDTSVGVGGDRYINLSSYGSNLQINHYSGATLGFIASDVLTAATSSSTLSNVSDPGVVITNTGAGATVTKTLPASPSLGNKYTIVRTAAQTIEFLANTGQTIRDGGSVSSSGGKLQLTAIGDVCTIEYVDTNKWFVIFKNGTAPTLT